MFGFVKVAAVSPKLHLGDIEANVQEITTIVKEHSDVAIFLFPELSITGYTLQDLFYSQILKKKVWEGLKELAKVALDRILIIGAPLWHNDRLYNCAVVLQDGKIRGVVPKSYLPAYREFYEKRWFSSGKHISSYIDDIPFGVDLLFESDGVVFGIEICEDLWSVTPPSLYQAAAGAHIIFNLSASDEIVGKHAYRKELVVSQSARGVCGYVYASSGIGESSQDLLFGGSTLIAENGILLAEGERFSFDSVITKADIDVEKLRHIRLAETSFKDAEQKDFRKVILAQLPKTPINRSFDPHPFVPKSRSLRDERCEEIFAIQSSALARRILHIGKETKLVIGVSGGLDSTLALLVCVEACKRLDKSLEDIVAISMPGFGTTKGTKNAAQTLAVKLGVTFKEISIKESVAKHLENIGHSGQSDVTFENAQARERTQILMDEANMVGGIVVGTGDMSEIALGFSTYNGDQMAMYNVNAGVPKTLVRYVIAWVASKNSDLQETLDQIINQPISPELLPAKDDEMVQRTEEIIGPYELHDFFLYNFVKYGATPKRILFMAKRAFKEQYDEATIRKWLRVFIKRFFVYQFKRDPMPDGVKVGTIALSPRGDWRMPSDATVQMWLKELEE
ncbi:NAD(+) synthase [Nitratiruptor sp. YY09-18]|uniref:NAD(+) synthase n=1 Tax=Nitratiruptor sp. YY09-18 TaxID=2724901 RepID=UPI0019160433|nr:NAD(+) synthase [Nitratiruptor sp. YY09-18]BCD68458.1 NAD+ synthase (glutamine-hydrolysing) [Nitratiruptor sp. YY09-18]